MTGNSEITTIINIDTSYQSDYKEIAFDQTSFFTKTYDQCSRGHSITSQKVSLDNQPVGQFVAAGTAKDVFYFISDFTKLFVKVDNP